MANEEFEKASHYNFVAHAVRVVESHEKEWNEKSFERVEMNKIDGPNSCFAAQKNEENLYELKAFGLLYLLKKNAADFWGKNEFDYYQVRIPTGPNGYVASTNWTKKPSQLKDVVFTDNNVDNILMTLDADDEFGDHWLNTPESIRFLKELKDGHRAPRAGDQFSLLTEMENNNETK